MGKSTSTKLVNTNPLRALRKALDVTGAQKNHPRIVQMYKTWVKLYRTQLYNRFKAASTGNGTWVPLAARTVRKKKSSLILIETRTLINAVDPNIYNAPGSLARRTETGMVVGYGGAVVHPTSAKKGRSTTIAEIAGFHQIGGGKLPQRQIIVAPTRETIAAVTAEIRDTINVLIAEAADK